MVYWANYEGYAAEAKRSGDILITGLGKVLLAEDVPRCFHKYVDDASRNHDARESLPEERVPESGNFLREGLGVVYFPEEVGGVEKAVREGDCVGRSYELRELVPERFTNFVSVAKVS